MDDVSLDSLRIADAEKDAVCVYWVDERARGKYPLDLWMNFLTHMAVDCDVFVMTGVSTSATCPRAVNTIRALLEHSLTDHTWSVTVAVQESLRPEEISRRSLVFCRQTVQMTKWEAVDGALVVWVERNNWRLTVRIKGWAAPSDIGNELERVAEGVAVLGSWPNCMGKCLLDEEGVSAVVNEKDSKSEASFVVLDTARSHQSSALVAETSCPVRAVLLMSASRADA